MNLANNLKRIRKEHNLSQEDLAEALNVSRQSVSKWEGGSAYPEMDKVIQICKMFNLNVDELLNQDIKEVNNKKSGKNNINKYIDDFLDYFTKVINLFSAMKFKQKIKCIFEQLIIIGLLSALFFILGAIGKEILVNILSFLPYNIYNHIVDIFKGLYLCVSICLSFVILLHIFKIRYLNYYLIVDTEEIKKEDIVNNNDKKIEKEELKDNKTSKIINNNKEKIIIRDPKHSGYKIISGLLKCLLFFIKSIVFLIGILFSISFVSFSILLVLSFVISKSGILFIGLFLLMLSSLNINLLILIIIYNFLTNKKNKLNLYFVSFIITLLLTGISIGLIIISVKQFSYISDINNNNYIETEETLEMDKDIFFMDYNTNINYIESDNKDLKIVFKHYKNSNIEMYEDYYGGYYFIQTINEDKIIDTINDYINQISNKQIIDNSIFEINIYTTKENIKIIQNNTKKYNNERTEFEESVEEYKRIIENQNDKIYKLEEENINKENQIEDLKNNYEDQISEYKSIIEEKNNHITDLQNENNNCIYE